MKKLKCIRSQKLQVHNVKVSCIYLIFFAVGSPTTNRAAALRVLSGANDIIKSLVPLACRKDNILIRLVAELLGLFCTIGKRVGLYFQESHQGNMVVSCLIKETSVGMFY